MFGSSESWGPQQHPLQWHFRAGGGAVHSIKSGHSHCNNIFLFDHLVGAGENRIRHGQAEGLGGLEIDDELEPGRQLDRQLARLGTIEDAIDIGGGTPVAVGEVLAVADQSSGLYVLPEREDRRQPVLERELRDSLALLDEK